jgi:hypothetical protein
VGRRGAHDQTSSNNPVTSFLVDSAEYERAEEANGGLDRDNDGIACERK